MIDIFSFFLGFIIGFSIATISIYYWIKRYVLRLILDKEKMLKNIMEILESKRK